jgi:hypothetical protein
MVDANRGDFSVKRFDAEFGDEFVLEGMAAFGAEAADAFVGVVALKGGEVHYGDGAQEPGGLVVFFNGAASAEGRGAAFDSGGVDADRFDPVEVEGDAAVGLEGEIAEVGEGGVAKEGGVSGSREVVVGDGHGLGLDAKRKFSIWMREAKAGQLGGGQSPVSDLRAIRSGAP